MITILLIVLIILAFGGFGHTGYRRGWYGAYNQPDTPMRGGWAGGGLGVFLLVIVLILLLTGNFHVGP